MNDFKIIIDQQTFKISSLGGDFTGTICFKASDCFFPDPAWNDYILQPLRFWTTSLNQLLSGQSKEVEFIIMDGPFKVRAERSGENIKMAFMREGFDSKLKPRDITQFESVTSLVTFIDELIKAIEVALDYASEKSLNDHKVANLKKDLETLSAYRNDLA